MGKETNINPQYVIKQRASIGDRIFIRRLKLGISASKLADEIGVKEMTILKIEAGSFEFGIDLIIKISITLNFKIEFNYES